MQSGVPAGAAPEVRRLAELGATGVAGAVEGDVRRAGPGRVDTRDRRAVLAQQLTVDRDAQSAEAEAGVERLARREVVGTPRPVVERPDPLGRLVELGVLARRRILVVARERGDEVARRHPQRALHLFHAL